MRRFILLALLAAAVPALPARAQDDYPRRRGMSRGQAMVNRWVRQCLHRAPSPADWANAAALDDGSLRPEEILTQLFGCDEYYGHVGGTPRKYIHRLFRDMLGRGPTAREEDYWMHRLRAHVAPGWEGRVELASQFLHRYPVRVWAGPAPVEDDNRYRRPHYRDHDHDDHYDDRD